MKPELTWLLWALALTFAQVLVGAMTAQGQVGLAVLVGSRDRMPALTGLAGRAQRAHRNMLENLALFVPLVLIAVVSGRTNASTLLGAQLFVWARLVYVGVYLAGVAWVRTGVWAVSLVGLGLIAAQLL